jgi:rhodanese-related sulfurtransferase
MGSKPDRSGQSATETDDWQCTNQCQKLANTHLTNSIQGVDNRPAKGEMNDMGSRDDPVRRQPKIRVRATFQAEKEDAMPSPTQITVSQLARLIGMPDAPVLVDICIDEDFEADPRFVPGAFRHPFKQIGGLADQLQGKRVVVICQKGKKLSQGAAAILRDLGVQAESLQGGNFEWRDAGEPLIPASKIPLRNAQGRTVWVTRHRPKVDRIATPWLIRRFIDPNAQFLFVEPSEVMNVADKFDATPFDVEGAAFSHHKTSVHLTKCSMRFACRPSR